MRLNAAIVATMLLFLVSPAQARQTGWITGTEWEKISRTLERKGEYPVSVQCKDSGAVGLSMDSGIANVRIEKNTRKTAWYWAVGPHFAVMKPRLERAGYKLVSSSEYRRVGSGLLVKCGIWHKER